MNWWILLGLGIVGASGVVSGLILWMIVIGLARCF